MANMSEEEEETVVALSQILNSIRIFLILFSKLYEIRRRRQQMLEAGCGRHYSLIDRAPDQRRHLDELVGISDVTALDNIRMNIDTFRRLCYLLENVGGLRASRNVDVPEQVAMFLSILGHHTKNVVIRTTFKRSTWTISKYFHSVILALLKLHQILLVTPKPATANNDNERWDYFQGCLGAFDGTYIDVRVPAVDQARYRNRKGQVSVNVLAACDMNMNFVYVLTGWEGSAADNRVLRDAITRPHGLKISTGHYYLVDCGYTNGPGFLAPYRGVRYHLKDYGGGTHAPQNYKEFFNLKHAKARNVIERAFGILKSRFAILRSHSYYPIDVQNQIILACTLIHNFIRTTNAVDPFEDIVPDGHIDEPQLVVDPNYVDSVESSNQWNHARDTLAMSMYNAWLH